MIFCNKKLKKSQVPSRLVKIPLIAQVLLDIPPRGFSITPRQDIMMMSKFVLEKKIDKI
ncbi:MAG: hypothetical protein ACTSVY_10235 [Candidatus Helarchaeota archaeon]